MILQGADTFYLGGYGEFDQLALQVVRKAKSTLPDVHCILVTPYMNVCNNLDLYDETIYPPLENVPSRYAIVHRNRWMAESADVVLAYVLHNWGGAYTAAKWAKQKGVNVIYYER